MQFLGLEFVFKFISIAQEQLCREEMPVTKGKSSFSLVHKASI